MDSAQSTSGDPVTATAAPPKADAPAAPATTSTPMRLKPPSKIAHVTVKPIIMPGSTPAASAAAPAENAVPLAAEPSSKHETAPNPDDFKVHTTTTSLKRKQPESTLPGRNTRSKTSADAPSTRSTATTARTTTTRAGLARTAAPRTGTATTKTRAAAAARPGAAGTGLRSTLGRGGITKPAPRPVTSRTTATARSVSSRSTSGLKEKEVAEESSGSSAAAKKKRPAWDVKGRLQDLEENHHATQSQLQDSESRLNSVTDELARSKKQVDELLQYRQNLQIEVGTKEKENHTYAQQLSDLKHELQMVGRRHEDELHSVKSRHTRELDDVKQELSSLQRKYDTVSSELSSARDENVTLRSTISTQSALSVSMEAESRANKLKLEQTEETVRQRDASIAELEKELAAATETVTALEAKVREEETMRRRLHNTIQELKGNIRVFCRVRPPLPHEQEGKDEVLTHIGFAENDEKAIELKQSVESASGQKTVAKSYPFSFDRVFQPGTQQAVVFDEISQLVQSALDGYNVCIFAYGQTGSGKTFTMEGPDNVLEHPEDMGMIPRAVHQIFESAQALKDKGWEYEMEAQFLEIYNESIRDLVGGSTAVGDGKHDIKHHPVTGKTSVTDICTVQVTTPKEVHSVLNKASHNRAVAATNCNERSSRSHSVFTLRLTGTNSLTGETSSGILNLIDLAGSERLSSSGSTGDRLKETQAINKSLSCLGDVIYALANGDKHVPYRNSKLTYLLQGSLGGNSKTLMFVNVSPLATNFQETLCSLRFATKVNSCQIGTAKKVLK